MSDEDKKTGISTQLRKLQAELKAPKNETGRFGKHRNVEGILEALKPLLTKYEMALVLDNEIIEAGGRTYVKATARLFYDTGNEVETLEVSAQAWEGDLSRGLDAAQVTGSASSYARKYALGGLFAIDDTKDADSHMDAAPPSKKDPVTIKQKLELQQLMKDQNIEQDAMADFVREAIGTEKVTTIEEYEVVKEALTEAKDES